MCEKVNIENVVSVKIPMFGKNKYPMCQFKDVDYELELQHSMQRYKQWKEYKPLKRLASVNWTPTFLAVTENRYDDRDGD